MFAGIPLVVLAVVGVLPGTPVRATVSGGTFQTLRLDVPADRFVRCAVDQGETDLKIAVVFPDGRLVIAVDQRERAVERVGFRAGPGGAYGLRVSPVSDAARRAAFVATCDPFHPQTDRDELFVEAGRLATEAKQIFARGDRASIQQAFERLTIARDLWRRLGASDMELAAATGLADALYALSDYSRADAAYREALSMSRASLDHRTEAEVLNNLGMVGWRLGNISDALSLLQEAIDRWRAVVGLRYGEAAALSNRGILLQETGEYDEARQHFARALTFFRSLGDRRGEAFALNNITAVLAELGRDGEALREIQRAVTLFRRTGDRLAEGRALVWQARIQFSSGRRPAALSDAQRGLALIRTSANRLAEADTLRHIGRFLEADDMAGAREHYTRALALYRDVGSRRGQADAAHDLAVNYLSSGEPAAALPLFDEALRIRRALGMRRLEAETLFRMAQAQRAHGDLPGAHSRLQSALDLVEDLRGRIFERELRTSYLSAKESYYGEYVAVLVERHRRDPLGGFAGLAFDVSERRRARELNERLQDAWAREASVVAPALVAEEQRLRRQINYWSWQVWRQADRAEAAERERFLRGRIDASLAEAAELEARLRRTVPAYAASLRSDFVDVATVQRETLDRDTVLLHYMLGKEHSYLWAVTTSTVTVSELPGRAVLEPLARGVYRLLQAGSAGAGDRGSLAQQHIAALSRHLLSPVADALADHRRLFVVPDGALHYVPFSLLIHPARSAPLVAFNDVAMLPSATTLGLLRRQTSSRAPAPKALAVLADPVFDALDSRVRVRSRAPAAAAAGGWIPRRLSRLPFSREEADRIAGLVAPAQRLKAVDFEASRALATSPQLADYRILHFATHAIQDDERPSLSGIVLSLVDESGSALDGFLRLHELYTLKLRADLVVLSACETGIGPGAGTGATAGGEGVSSLARGFFHAGAGRVVSTLWKVDDEATAAMMRFFYEALLADPAMAPAAALRTAQAEMRRQSRWRDPYFWAAFVIHGDW